MQEFCSEAIVQAVFRRIMMMDYFVEHYIDPPEDIDIPGIIGQKVMVRKVYRYSSTHNAQTGLKGITGSMVFEDISEELLPYLVAGELLHIGKNSSFGFGKYRLS